MSTTLLLHGLFLVLPKLGLQRLRERAPDYERRHGTRATNYPVIFSDKLCIKEDSSLPVTDKNATGHAGNNGRSILLDPTGKLIDLDLPSFLLRGFDYL